MAGPLVFFVPLAIAGGRVFFKFATKKAAQAFKGRFAKAGNVTTRTPPKNANVTTTGSAKGQSIIKDMTKPVTKPSVRSRNPNTTTLPKTPKSSGGGKVAGAAATGVGVAASSTSTGEKSTKDDSRKQYRPSKGMTREQKLQADSTRAKAEAIVNTKTDAKPKKKTTVVNTKTDAKPKNKKSSTPSRTPISSMKTPTKKKAAVPTPKPKPKLYSTIDPKTGKQVDKKVSAKQHLANLDAAKKRGLLIGSQNTKAARVKAAKEMTARLKKLIERKKGK